MSDPQSAKANSPDDKCVFVIFNPVSGQSDPEQRKKAITEALSRHGYTCQFIATSEQEGAKALAEKALADGASLLAVSGGDGTVMETLSAVVGKDIPVAVLPAGTGNLLSVNLGIPTTVPEAVDVALSGHPYALDLARTNEGRYFAIMGGIGLDAQIIAGAGREAKKRLGVLAYFLAAVRNLPRRRSFVLITLDDKPPLRRRVKTVLLANMGKITGGLEAMPTASPNDGLLDVGILQAETLGQWLRLLGYALRGRAHDAPDLEVHQAKRVTLHARHPIPVEFDGENGGQVQRLSVEIVPRAVTVLLPEGAPAARDTQGSPAQAAQKAARPLLPVLVVLAAVGSVAWGIRRWRRK